ncbi:hypothetical protein Pint_12738 [Pistacia integerrima]|uniref:Uncharacterized protein n=1 Tax=Pistacia integerrima TaxID=434235 RepID=A0ACC0YAU4_9ROSI|nr:hypothetical protein Pint_12738 [Pistacia integerrima]
MSTLSEAYRDFPLHLHHIIPLDFNSTRAVPESHIWPNSDDLISSHDHPSLPVIDLNDPQVTQLIGHACETWGAFQLVNHGIPLNLLKDAESETRRLFSLPTRQKLKVLRAPGGTTGYGIARITPFFAKYMWHEGFTIIGSPFDHAKQLWPHDHAQFCDVMENYQKKMRILAERLTKLIFESLEISEEELIWVDSTTALQLNSYPSCPDPNRALGLAPHTDTSMLTILHQSSISGLQIFKEGVGWVSVMPIADALVVNVGDLLHILSNARCPNVLHRVLVRERHRLSMAVFYCPPMDFNLVPVAKSGQAPKYRSVTEKEFISIKAKHLEKALSFIKL